jgi:phosphate:Na+ symporter
MKTLFLLLSVVGSLGLFLFGLKLMSESLQKILGDKLRFILTTMSSNKIRGVLTGILIAVLLQSSSATTVIVVSFVNAGMIRLGEAIAIIMGANIGTTVTAWLISVLGFKLNLTTILFPLVGLIIPLAFSKRRNLRTYGEVVIGLVILLISIIFLKQIIPIYSDCVFAQFIRQVGDFYYLSAILFFTFGVLVAYAIRSSNASFLLSLTLFYNGWLPFELAMAMVLGANVGTTITGVLAARIANTAAKRSALANLLFNFIGAVWVIVFFYFIVDGISWLNIWLGGTDPAIDPKGATMALALFHTLFNLLNMMLLFWFTKPLGKIIHKMAPASINPDTDFRLLHIKTGMLSTPDASLYQARRETVVFAERTRKMFRNVEKLMSLRVEKDYDQTKQKVLRAKDFSDRLEKEIATYLTKVGEMRLSESSSRHLRGLYKIIDDLKSIAESSVNITNAIDRKRYNKYEFPEQIHNNVQLIFNMVNESLDIMVTMMSHDEEMPLSMAQETEREINNYRDILKSDHLNNLERGIYNYNSGIIYNDIISQCERIGDFALDVDETYKTLLSSHG